ncbi:hypothetical protein DUNSADRAFT_14209 [Dunaliella salina]|uniref:Uncharacterized protein n=1 Tax=Dunaliella salina TaxID=3046 RepID=A0ABQ7G7U0_DUNSA|nr:hypothetical protein DUNSADRAFT_14209 [Dunaliella salina]|eukprot:KAF5830671.1 hypothetical protein DUNSADRAFT_14209 [Dunaliella salina]
MECNIITRKHHRCLTCPHTPMCSCAFQHHNMEEKHQKKQLQQHRATSSRSGSTAARHSHTQQHSSTARRPSGSHRRAGKSRFYSKQPSSDPAPGEGQEEAIGYSSRPALIRLQERARKRQSDTAAGLRWCAQQLASSYDGFGDSEAEALAYLEQKGVECKFNCGPQRLFRFPGCSRPISKKRLAEALGLQRKPTTEAEHEHLAEALHWCAQKLASAYQGVGDNQEQALDFLKGKGVVCTKNLNGVRLFCIPGRTSSVSKDHLAAALGLQKKPGLLERLEEGLVWLAEKYCGVYQIGNLEPGKASVEDVLAELRKMGVQSVESYRFQERTLRRFSLPGKIEHCNSKALAAALRLKLVPGCTGTSKKHSTSSGEIHERGMLWLATNILKSPRYRQLFGGTDNPQEVRKELANKGVWCYPNKKGGYFSWKFKIKGKPGKVYYKDGVMHELFPEAFPVEEPKNDLA